MPSDLATVSSGAQLERPNELIEDQHFGL